MRTVLSAVRDATIYTQGCPVVCELDDQQMLHIIRTATIRSSIKNRYVIVFCISHHISSPIYS